MSTNKNSEIYKTRMEITTESILSTETCPCFHVMLVGLVLVVHVNVARDPAAFVKRFFFLIWRLSVTLEMFFLLRFLISNVVVQLLFFTCEHEIGVIAEIPAERLTLNGTS